MLQCPLNQILFAGEGQNRISIPWNWEPVTVSLKSSYSIWNIPIGIWPQNCSQMEHCPWSPVRTACFPDANMQCSQWNVPMVSELWDWSLNYILITWPTSQKVCQRLSPALKSAARVALIKSCLLCPPPPPLPQLKNILHSGWFHAWTFHCTWNSSSTFRLLFSSPLPGYRCWRWCPCRFTDHQLSPRHRFKAHYARRRNLLIGLHGNRQRWQLSIMLHANWGQRSEFF